MLGVGVMIQQLSGNDSSVKALLAALNKEISRVQLVDDELRFKFTDDSKLVVRDEGQSCCEHRYMTTDDDLSAYEGATLTGMELKDVTGTSGQYDEHDVQFLEVQTNKGVFTMASHNEHNGYYGGFAIRCSA